jgi:hypothetical protein
LQIGASSAPLDALTSAPNSPRWAITQSHIGDQILLLRSSRQRSDYGYTAARGVDLDPRSYGVAKGVEYRLYTLPRHRTHTWQRRNYSSTNSQIQSPVVEFVARLSR